MRRLPIRPQCVTAALLMDAFGFFDTENENEAVLREAARVLTCGGRLGLKVVNGGQVIDTFRETDREERDGTVATVSRTLTFGPPRMTERISVSGSRGNGEYERRQRLYRVDEVRAALDRVGLSVVGVFASPDRARFESTSPTMWIVAQQRGTIKMTDTDTRREDEQSSPLMTLIRAIASRDEQKASRLLDASPGLAQQVSKIGATRQVSTAYYFKEIEHYVYAGDTALHIAAAAYARESAKKLLAKGANVRARNRRGAEPLHYAVDGIPSSHTWNPTAQEAIVECLIEAGADPNSADKSGVTPLHRAVRTRCAAVVRMLLANGADPRRKNGSGSSSSGGSEHRTWGERIVSLAGAAAGDHLVAAEIRRSADGQGHLWKVRHRTRRRRLDPGHSGKFLSTRSL